MSPVPLAEAVIVARAHLDGVASAGGHTFDPAAYTFAETLLRRGEALGGPAGERLVARAVTRATELARALGEAKADARSTLSDAGDPSGALARALEAGDVGPVLRARRRAQSAPREGARNAFSGWRARTSRRRAREGLPLGHVLSPGAISEALYTSSRDELSAMLGALRAEGRRAPRTRGPT